jgi:hypothetical protein
MTRDIADGPAGPAGPVGDSDADRRGPGQPENAGRGSVDVLTQGQEGSTLGTAIVARLRRSAAVVFAGRHPRGVATAGCLAAAAAILCGYLVSRPPAVGPEVGVHAEVSAGVHFLDDGGPYGDDAWLHLPGPGQKLTARYSVSADVVGERIRVVGIVGPGLRTPTADDAKVRSPAGPPLRTGATLDCSRSAWWAASVRDYRIRVRRTNANGTATAFDAPIGLNAGDWRDLVQQACLRGAASRLVVDQWTAEATPGSPQVRVSLRVRNPNPFPFQVKISSWGTGVSESTPTVAVPAAGMTRLTVRPLVEDCTDPSATPYFYRAVTGASYLVLRVGLEKLLPPITSSDDPELVGLVLDRSQVASLDRAMARACQGAPTVAATVTGVRRVAAPDPALRWRIAFGMRVQADRVEFGAASLLSDSHGYPSLGRQDENLALALPPAARSREGTARTRLIWTLSSCAPEFGEIAGPPYVQITVVVAGRRYSHYLVLPDARLLAAYRAACPASGSDAAAAALGWRVPS